MGTRLQGRVITGVTLVKHTRLENRMGGWLDFPEGGGMRFIVAEQDNGKAKPGDTVNVRIKRVSNTGDSGEPRAIVNII